MGRLKSLLVAGAVAVAGLSLAACDNVPSSGGGGYYPHYGPVVTVHQPAPKPYTPYRPSPVRPKR